MKTTFKTLLSAAMLFSAASSNVVALDTLKPHGKSVKLNPLGSYTILMPEKRTEQERVAAYMLADYLKRATGLKLKIAQEPEKPEGNVIHVGETALAKSTGPAPVRQSYSIAVKEGNLVIRGGIYGVIALLEEDFGVRWYQKNEKAVVPKLNPDQLEVVPRSYAPVFEIREPLYDDAMGITGWSGFNRLQPASDWIRIVESMGGGFSNSRYFIHTYDRLIPAKKYYESHPEYFPQKDGKRFKSSQNDGQLCYTSQGVADAMAEEIERAIEANPTSRVYSVSQNDNLFVNCECEECQKVIKLDGIPGASLLLANRVSERLAKKLPDIRVTTLAYCGTQSPTKHILPAPNTVIFYAPIKERGGSLQYLPWSDVPKIAEELAGWRKIAKRIYVWDYVNKDSDPFPNFDVVDRNIRYWRENGVCGVFLESKEFHLNSLGALKAWVFAKKIWNPDWNMDDLIEDFISGYYGAAAPEMREYVAFQRKKWKDFYATHKPGDSVYFTPEDRTFMKSLLEKAYVKTPDVKIASELCPFYAMTLTACTKQNVAEYEKNLNRVNELLAKYKLQMDRRQKGKMNKRLLDGWKEQLADVKSGSKIPVFCNESILLKKRSLWLKIKAHDVLGAYTGKVPRQFAKTDWGVQWDFAKFLAAAVNQGVYVVRMRVKPDFKQKYDGEDKAFSLHLWRSGISGTQGRYVKFSELKGDDWQYVYPFKVYVYTPAVTGYFYNCIGDLAEEDGIFYDLIEFIPIEKFKDKQLADSLPQITL